MKYNRHERTSLGQLGSSTTNIENAIMPPPRRAMGAARNSRRLNWQVPIAPRGGSAEVNMEATFSYKHTWLLPPATTNNEKAVAISTQHLIPSTQHLLFHIKITGIIGCYLLGLCLICGIFAPAWASEDMSTYGPKDCMECHSSNGGDSSLQISPENFSSSVHGSTITCLGCHTDITDDAHMEGDNVKPVDCSRCHGIKAGTTGMFSAFSTFRISSHGKADFAGNYKMDNCLGCHQGTGAHGERGPINDQNCFKCHDPGLKNALWGKMHPDQRNKALPVVFLYICLALFLLVAVMRQVTPALDRTMRKINNKGKR